MSVDDFCGNASLVEIPDDGTIDNIGFAVVCDDKAFPADKSGNVTDWIDISEGLELPEVEDG